MIAGAATAQPLETRQVPATTALAQSSSDISVSGKVVSSTSTELVIDAEGGKRMTFALDPTTTPATTFKAGERVTVQYHSNSGGTVYQAASVAVEPAGVERREQPVTTTKSETLPRTASSLPWIGLLGLLAVSGAAVVRMARS
jgi:hypothetical protein